jgi:hypothetical protein
MSCHGMDWNVKMEERSKMHLNCVTSSKAIVRKGLVAGVPICELYGMFL